MLSIRQVDLPEHLFWEFDPDQFDVQKNQRLVIERVVARGTIPQWRIIVRLFGADKVLEIVEGSKHLSRKDKVFTPIFLRSSLLDAV